MITSPRERGDEAKQESNKNDGKLSKATSSSRQWGGFRNPRIVRVSRTFGGKDRHSKVCTIRGLRDRRIRLSVPTAIQLYDLQERLGLSQPSKVVDWLLDATKHDIDKLPPLQLPQGFGQFHQDPISASQSSLPPFFDANFTFPKAGGAHSLGININDNVDREKSRFWDADAASRGKSKVDRETTSEKNDSGYNSQVSAQNFFPSLPGSYYNWEPSLSQFGGHGFLPQQTENPPSGSQLIFCPSTSLFPPYPSHINAPEESDPRHMNNIQLFSSSSLMPSSVSKFNPDLLHSQNAKEHQPDDDETES